ncbi:hypothetical protein TPHA_0H02520 [Tetrapisispora phaffii CBS 4417]|uniref:Pet127p n=1 Tax=Tetrapisispora phaffii (strain ATCC 24235 / CBS 4417 / NBRC 1672 / NRRL Y-8282 / UCD 70-5) TaxID=1071381 RepID=G8BWK4_TETPH|nr:hypothetical protein TPHA_0H02520 [Tetrapisispora phaffii CBS 4417]CCE64455.1 hypothetical protein TPHA_0H02520 [Tetrapisispora phaffii CBS 4417]
MFKSSSISKFGGSNICHCPKSNNLLVIIRWRSDYPPGHRNRKRRKAAFKRYSYSDTNAFTCLQSDSIWKPVRPSDISGNKQLLDYEKLPKLRDSLEKVLYEPLVLHTLRDERTGAYNYDKTLEVVNTITPETSSSSLNFIPPQKDEILWNMANQKNLKYISSTSSMTAVLSQLHFLLSNCRALNVTNYLESKDVLLPSSKNFKSAQIPASIIVSKLKKTVNHKVFTVKSIDSDPYFNREMILSALGHTLEEFLTRGGNQSSDYDPNERHYHYSIVDDFLIRSQLDCYNPLLPNNGVFDLKTRAVGAIRYDLPFVERNLNYTGYEINKLHGQFESMNREFKDMIKGPLLKYSLQARMGAMDGIFVAYHNINRIFGFQYLPLEYLDHILHSASDYKFRTSLKDKENITKSVFGINEHVLNHEYKEREISTLLADAEFKLSMQIFKKILVFIENKYAANHFKWEKLKIMMKIDVSKAKEPKLDVICLPMEAGSSNKYLSPLVRDNDSKNITAMLDRVKAEHDQFLKLHLKKAIGLVINVKNIFGRHSSSPNYSELFNTNSTVDLDFDDKSYLNHKMNKDFYENSNRWMHPNFLDPEDVQTWKVNGNIIEMTESKIKTSYSDMIKEKLSFIEKENNEDFSRTLDKDYENDQLKTRIIDYIKNEKSLENIFNRSTMHKKQNNDDFRLTFRAYGKKGAIRYQERQNRQNQHNQQKRKNEDNFKFVNHFLIKERGI